MTDPWEYMSLEWTYSTRQEFGVDGGWAWTREFHIHRPGEERESRSSYDSKDPDADEESLGDLLNEFGLDGWELVSETPLASTVVETLRGWKDVGVPVRMRWLLKRQSPT